MKPLLIMPLIFLTYSLGACSKNDSKTTPNSNQEVCSLEGTWGRCSVFSETSSGFVRLTISGSTLEETISEFSDNTTCSGEPSSSFSFQATNVTVGELGASLAIEGGTDVDLTPNLDFAGCGANQPVYTSLKLSSSCDQFLAASTVPGCTPNDRGTAFDPAPFLRE